MNAHATEALYADLVDRGFRLVASDKRLLVEPGSLLSDGDCVLIARHKAELIDLVAGDWLTEGNDAEPTNSLVLQPIPTSCIARRVCPVIGICGRVACLNGLDASDWTDRIEAARSPSNPHRIRDDWIEHRSGGTE